MHVTFKPNGLESWFLVQMNLMDSKMVPDTNNRDQLVQFGQNQAKPDFECAPCTPLLIYTHTLPLSKRRDS